MSAPILVTGGTGTLGRLVVPRLLEAGGTLRVLSRRSRQDADGVEFVTGDLSTGEGIEAAVTGTEIIVHCAGTTKGDEDKTRRLARAGPSWPPNGWSPIPACRGRRYVPPSFTIRSPPWRGRWPRCR
jgi:NAD(P)-dependent dehydrogenase (short-subunit alcohol dehydrogenase family)